MSTESWLLIALVSAFTLTAAVWDFRTKRIPNWLTVPAFAAALLYHAVVGAIDGGWSGLGLGLLTALGGFAVGFGILFVLWLVGGGGAGDVKLMGALGAWLGATNTLLVFFVSTLFVLVLSVAVLTWQMFGMGMWGVKRRYLSAENTKKSAGLTAEESAMKHKVRRRLLPYGVPVALATWVVLAWAFRDQWLHH